MPGPEAAVQPAGLKLTASTQTSFSVGWQPSTDNVGVTGYDVTLDGRAVGTTTDTSKTFTGLDCDERHVVGVRARDAAGNLSGKTEVTVTTAPCGDKQPPSTPTGLRVAASTSDSVSVAWQPSTDNVGVTGYTVFLDGRAAGTHDLDELERRGLGCGTSYTSSASTRYDAAGNLSSQARAAATAACPDTTPPSQPTTSP